MNQRIEMLRADALHCKYSHDNDRFHTDFYTALSANGTFDPERYTEAFQYAYSRLEPMIGEGELIVGKPALYNDADVAAWCAIREQIRKSDVFCFDGGDAHMAIDYELLLKEGIEGLIARIDAKLAVERDAEKIKFYRRCHACLVCVEELSERYAQRALEMAKVERDAARKAELEALGVICRNVPRYPAKSFYEAVQSVNFMTFCIVCEPGRLGTQQFMLGRIDRYLYPFYKADIAAGTLTHEFARELIDCLAIQINNRMFKGLSAGYMVGGRDPDGKPVANELTELGLQAIDDVRLVYPAVGLCYTADMPEHILDLACRILSHGRSHPAIFNDDLIVAGLEHYGVPHEDAIRYIHSTCVEITPEGASNIWVASPYTNMAQLLLETLQTDVTSFDALLSAYFERLDAHIAKNAEIQNQYRAMREKRTVMPLLSCFVKDCIETGKDINAGGARYNWVMPSFVGVANLVDSLYVIQKAVFEEGVITLKDLGVALADNFAGNEALRLKFLNKYDKYGNDCDEVDALFGVVTEHIAKTCQRHEMYFDSKLIPSVFCWTMHDRFGQVTGATPDGRLAAFPLGDGSGPCQGRERLGPTASVLSSTKWSHKEFIGGVAVNMKFSKKSFDEASHVNMKSIIKTYIARGGFEMQINVLDRETLLAAQRTPELYQDLVVRIGGYSDYFTKLTPTMQEEVLLRTEHGL